MITEWSLAEAKNKFSEVVRKALGEGPQFVRRRKETVVILSGETYERLTGEKPGLKAYLAGDGPGFEGLDLARDRSLMRDARL